MLDILTLIGPMFILLGVGMCAGFFKRFAGAHAALNTFVFHFSLPAFLFTAVASAPIHEGVPWGFLGIVVGVTCGAFFVVFITASVLNKRSIAHGRPIDPGSLAIASSYGNVGYLGVPIVLALVGPDAALGAAIGQFAHNLLFMAGYPLLAASAGGEKGKLSFWGGMKAALVMNPVVLGILAGIAVGYFGIHVPEVIEQSIAMLGNAAIPVAMFAVGLTIRPAIASIRAGGGFLVGVVTASVIKIALLPLATLACAMAFSVSLAPEWIYTAVLLAAMPVSSTASILASEQGGDARLVGATTVISSLVAVVSVPALVLLMNVSL